MPQAPRKPKKALPEATVKKSAQLSAWAAEILRLTAFHLSGPQKDDQNWWEETVGESPEAKNLKPREGGYEVTGPHVGSVLTLKADFNRFDWLFIPKIDLEKPPATFPILGSLPEAMDAFLPLVRSWLPKAPGISRLAFGAVIHQPAEDRIAGYRLLAPYVPFVELDPEHSSDLSYQINRHYKAESFEKLHINRISKWSVARFQSIAMVLGPNVATASTRGQVIHAVRLELDISTDAERTAPLPHDQLQALFDHLVALGKEIASKGDIK